jgi:hypothetical protein
MYTKYQFPLLKKKFATKMHFFLLLLLQKHSHKQTPDVRACMTCNLGKEKKTENPRHKEFLFYIWIQCTIDFQLKFVLFLLLFVLFFLALFVQEIERKAVFSQCVYCWSNSRGYKSLRVHNNRIVVVI